MADALRRDVREIASRLVSWRRDLHRHPELGFEERRTASFVASRLRELGLEVREGVAETGVLGLIRAERASGPAMLLRADMDALPIQETPGREYGSTVDGKMHACGHDGHVAMLLGAATLLADRRSALPRDVLLCFQPAEEGLGGGERMLREGALDWVEIGSSYGLHLWSGFPVGTIQVRSGATMAAQDEFRARIVGRGGHGALPHTAVDPIVAAAHAVVALQTVVSRTIDPVEPAVLTVGRLYGGTAPNVIPDEVRMAGTLRSFSEEVRVTLRRRLGEVLHGIAAAAGCTAEVELEPGFPAVVNDPAAVERVRRAAAQVVGPDNVIEPAPMAAAEDFAYYLRERPGAFVFVGAGNAAQGITAPHHSPQFDIDEASLPHGSELLARLALDGD